VDFCDFELQNALGVHDGLVRQWIRYLELYNAPTKQPERNIPYQGAANFMLPTMASDVDPMYAKFLQSLHATDNLWTTSALNERWVDANKPIQDFLTWLDGTILKMFNVNKRVVMEMVKLGTGIYKTGWSWEQRPVWTYNAQGRVEKMMRQRGVPFVDHVRLPDLVFPPRYYSLDPDEQGGAPIIWERHRISIDRLKWMATSASPLLPNIDKDDLEAIIKFEEHGPTEYDAAIQQQQYVKAASGTGVNFDTETRPQSVSGGYPSSTRTTREVEIWEAHARFPTGENNSQDDIIGWYHKPTRRFVRDVYNYYQHGKRPYEVVRFFPGDGFYGVGMCQQTEMFQLAESDIFNFTWDNAFLANSRMIVAKAGANIAAGEPFWPGKVWITDGDVRQDFTSFAMADVYQSLPMIAGDLQAKRERRNGIGDLQAGQLQSLPSRTPATTTLSLLQEGNRRPDLTLKDMRYSGLSAVGLRTLQNCQQFMTSTEDVGGQHLLRVAIEMLGQPEGTFAAQKLMLPAEAIEMGIGCVITATSGSKNKETAKQDYLALMQVAGQTSQAMIQMAQIAMQFRGTPVAILAEQAIGAQLELGKRLLEQYDIPNVDEIIPETPPQESAFAGAAGPAGVPPGTQQGGSPGGGAPQFDPSVQALYGGATAGV
jgi:hypothetical protein